MRRLSAIILIALLAPLVWPAVAARAAETAPPGDIYLAMGDSLALGVEAPANNDGQPGYPALLLDQARALNPALELQNTGIAGETSATFIGAAGAQAYTAEGVISSYRSAGQCVGLITLDIGGNDFGNILTGGTQPETAVSQFETNLNTILTRITGAAHTQIPGCSPRMALMDYYNPYPGLPIPPSNQPLSDMYLPVLNRIIHTTAANHGWAVAHVESAFRGREAELLYVKQGIYTNPLMRLPFTPWFEGNVDFHPRPAGHQVIADAFWQALELVPHVPTLLELPDLILSNVSLISPWTCGDCALAGRQQAALPALPEPDSRTIEWLGAQLWNRITRPLLCWNMAMFQSGLNVYASTLNTLWIPSLNQGYRLLFGLFFWLTSAFLSLWDLGEELRQQLWSINAALLTQAGGVAVAVEDLSSGLVGAWAGVFSAALQPWRYLVSLYMGIVTVMADMMYALTHTVNMQGDPLGEYRPPQLIALDTYWLFAATKGALRGLYESQLGWWLVAQISMFYLATAMYVIDQTSEV